MARAGIHYCESWRIDVSLSISTIGVQDPLLFWRFACTRVSTDFHSPRIVVADPNIADDILARRKDFIKRKSMFKPLELFGPNVDTLNGEAWQRHRRLTTPPFNERNSSLVWRESIVQANGMIKSWISKGRHGVVKTTGDTMTLALHVLAAAGFGKSYPFEGGVAKLSGNHKLSYKDALRKSILHLLNSDNTWKRW